MRKIIIIIAMFVLLPVSLAAQTNGSNSSYSRYGIGTLDEQSQTFNRGMGGVALGLRSGKCINIQNPASYSAIDSLSFLFDIGMSMQFGHLAGENSSVNVRNTSLSNVNAGFQVMKGLGMSFGFTPYSSIGYSFYNEGRVGSGYTTSKPITTTTSYTGSGGLRQAYIGAGWNPFSNLSIGANVSYLWGSYEHAMSQIFYEGSSSSTSYNSQNNTYLADIHSYKLDLGIQYPIRLNKSDYLTLGATYSLGHNLGGDATLYRYTSAGDSLTSTAKDAFSIPNTFGGGLSWTHDNQWVVAADVTYEKWGGCKLPIAETTASSINYNVRDDQYSNRTRYKFGLEYTPNQQNRNKYLQTVKYRLGFNYSTPYVKVNGAEGPTEYRVTAGLGLPLQSRKLTGRSFVNISAEWLLRKASASNLIDENYLMLNIGVTFNERWFLKWKIE